jgi:hypothetical protein
VCLQGCLACKKDLPELSLRHLLERTKNASAFQRDGTKRVKWADAERGEGLTKNVSYDLLPHEVEWLEDARRAKGERRKLRVKMEEEGEDIEYHGYVKAKYLKYSKSAKRAFAKLLTKKSSAKK